MGVSTEFIICISAPTIPTSFSSRKRVKGRLMCIILCPNIVQTLSAFLSRLLLTPRRHRCVMHEVVDETLRQLCHYQHNVPQDYYFLRIP